MVAHILYKNKGLIILSILLGIIATFFIPLVWIGLLAATLILIKSILDEKYIPLILIVAFLVITSDISEQLRIIVNLFGFLILGYLFIKNFGLEFKKYAQIPLLMVYFIYFTLASLLISSIFSANVSLGLEELLRQITFFFLIYIFYSLLHTKSNAKAYIYALLSAGIILALIIVYFFWSSHAELVDLETQGLVHEGGFYKNVAAAGGVFAITITINLAFLFIDKFKNTKSKIVLSFFLVLQVAALLLTNSRAAFLAAFIGSIYVLLKLNKKLFKKITISALTVSILLVTIFPKIIEIFDTFIRANRILENTRYYLWDIAFGIIKHNPILGCGPGMFKNYMYKYLPVMIGSWTEGQIYWVYKEAGAGQAHNFLLYRTSELGLLGLLGAIGLFIVFFYLAYKIYSAIKIDQEWRIIITAIIGSVIGLIFRSFFESTGLLTNGWITRDLPFWILIAVLIFLYQKLVVKNKTLEEI